MQTAYVDPLVGARLEVSRDLGFIVTLHAAMHGAVIVQLERDNVVLTFKASIEPDQDIARIDMCEDTILDRGPRLRNLAREIVMDLHGAIDPDMPMPEREAERVKRRSQEMIVLGTLTQHIRS